MGCIFDLIVEFIGEFFGELVTDVFVSLSDIIFPFKMPSKKMQNVVDWISTITSILMSALFMFGLLFFIIGLIDNDTIFLPLGCIFLGISLAFILVGIIFKIVKSKSKK